jgi:hypothetical protein
MSRNGSGTYSLPSGNPVVTNTTISSTWANTTLGDIATALTGSLAADGQTTATGNLQMGNNKIVNLNDGTDVSDAATFGQLEALNGRIVQVVKSSFTTTASTTSGTLVTTGHTASITPTSATSKILALVSCAVNNTLGNDSPLTLYRGSTNLAGTNSAFVSFLSISGGETGAPASFMHLDEPATTSSTTYSVYYASGGGTMRYNYPAGNLSLGQTATITLLEITV